MVRNIWRFGLPTIVVLGVAGLVVLLGSLLSENKPASGTLYTVRRGTISAVVRTTGKIEPVRQARLAFRTGESVRRVWVKPGDVVPAGTLLAELDTTRLEKELAQAEAQREISRFGLSAQAEKSQNSSAASIFELYGLARQSDLADNQLAATRAALENARLYAPFDGTVLSVEVSEGDNVNFGQPVITFADLSRFQVRAEIDEIDVANVTAGLPAQFSLDAFPGRSFDGLVIQVSPAPSQRQGSTVYNGLISFNKPAELYLRPGMAANVTITSLSRSEVLLVPNRALETIGLRKYATVQRPDGGLEKVPVETGLSDPDQTEIIGGLNEGARIIIPR